MRKRTDRRLAHSKSQNQILLFHPRRESDADLSLFSCSSLTLLQNLKCIKIKWRRSNNTRDSALPKGYKYCIRSTIMAVPAPFISPHLLFHSPSIYTTCLKKTNKQPLHKSELLFKDCESLVFLVSLDCNRMPEQVDHSLHPNGSHCYFKRADICWIGERGSFQRNDESPVLDCSERGPHEWTRTWQKRMEGRKEKVLSNSKKKTTNTHLFLISPSSHTLYFHSLYSHFFPLYISACCVNHFDFRCECRPKQFLGRHPKEAYVSGCRCRICDNRFNCPAFCLM